MKVLTVVGARPQFIKASVLSAELSKQNCEEVLIHTGQHYDNNMSQIFFNNLNLKQPKFYLGVGSASHAIQTAEMMTRLEPIVEKESPDWVLVYGDTNSTLAGCLVAAKMNLLLAHVESGLRSFNREMPEEVNRIVADHVATHHFAPTSTAVENLRREGISESVFLVGDLMVDLVKATVRRLPGHPKILERFGVCKGSYGVATVHRAANTENPKVFAAILKGLSMLDFTVIFPMHPRTANLILMERMAAGHNVVLCEPLSYFDTIALLANARIIITDSGGIQKEALTLGVPCVTLRQETEWVETLEDGWNILVGSDPDLIKLHSQRVRPSAPPKNHYGDGFTAQRIVQILGAGSVSLDMAL